MKRFWMNKAKRTQNGPIQRNVQYLDYGLEDTSLGQMAASPIPVSWRSRRVALDRPKNKQQPYTPSFIHSYHTLSHYWIKKEIRGWG